MTKFQTGFLSAVIAATAVLLIEHRSQVKLREENLSLRRQLEQSGRKEITELLSGSPAQRHVNPRLPAPHVKTTSIPPGEEVLSTNRLAQLFNGERPDLTQEQINTYLQQHHRDAASLLAIFRATGDKALLKEALEKYPGDPRVNFAAVFDKDASPEERRQRLDTFKQAAPDNAMASYLSALDHFKSGQSDQAVQELVAASGQKDFQDYSWDFVQNAEEAWRAAGYSEAELKMIATWDLELPHLAELRQLSKNLANLSNSYRQAGDEASAQAVLQMGIDLGQRMESRGTDPLISQLVGMAIQRDALGTIDPKAPWDNNGQTVQDRLNQLIQQRVDAQDLVKQAAPIYSQMSPQDWISYNDRLRAFGEINAIHWLLGKYSNTQP